MPDYYTSQQLAQTLGIAEATIAELQTKGLLQPTVKDGRSFFSSPTSAPFTRGHSVGTQRQNRFARGFRSRGRTLACTHERAEGLELWPPRVGTDFACQGCAFEVQTICEASRMEARTVGRNCTGPGGGSLVRCCFS